jgi:hypothetical protein
MKKVAILGAGIMGCSSALLLARKGFNVTLFDKAKAPFSAASRWNEGKVHLGYMYSADPSLNTAKHILPSSLQFKPIVEELIGKSIDAAVSKNNDIYLVHKDSVVNPVEMKSYFSRVDQLVKNNPLARDYLADASECITMRLTDTELSEYTNSSSIVAGFKIPERSISTLWLADQYLTALSASSNISLKMGVPVNKIFQGSDGRNWFIDTDNERFGSFDIVVNALWENKLSHDKAVGLQLPDKWSHRYRRALFFRTNKEIETPCCIICTGPFGDLKNYNNRNFYLSWYPEGLTSYTTDVTPIDPQELSAVQKEEFITRVFDKMALFVPIISALRNNIESITVAGGWVFAAGEGDLASRSATLHQRATFGIQQKGSYFSVDTGKFSSAPLLAKLLANEILG